MSTVVALVALLSASGVFASIGLYLGVVRLIRAGKAASRVTASSPPIASVRLAEVPGAVRLPVFDLSTSRTASGTRPSARQQETTIGNLRFVQSDAGQGQLGILAEYASEAAGSAVLPMSVVMADGRGDYFLIFRQEESGRWIASLDIPRFSGRAAVFVNNARERATLTAEDAPAVARSVRVSPDSWVTAWKEVERERPEGDPVREAITRALRSLL